MTKLNLGHLIQNTLDLHDWKLHARVPSNILLTRNVAGGRDTLLFQPYRGVYSFSFGSHLFGTRTYAAVVEVIRQTSAHLPLYADYTFQAYSRRVNEMMFAEIINPSDFDPWLPTARAMVHEDVLPQLERYRYLGPLHERIAHSSLIEVKNFMPNSGNGASPHIAIIKHLVGASDAESFLTGYIHRFEEAGAAYAERASLLKNIQNILQTTPVLSHAEAWGPSFA